ncbi:MAG TPA: potassium transporter TrkG [Gemmatimonadales bacterium]
MVNPFQRRIIHARTAEVSAARRFERWSTHRRRSLVDVWADISPSRLLVSSFALLIVLGTLGLRLLPGLYTGERLGWVDSLFMATSAVCVTGLSVIDPAADLTLAGQLWLLLLIQLGGLGLLTLTSGILLTVGRRLSLRHEELVRSGAEAAPEVDYRELVRRVLRYTFLIELAGAALLWAATAPRLGAGAAVWPAVFHAVSAFCNAGFSVVPGNLATLRGDFPALTVIMTLIVMGGLGFLTLTEILPHGAGRWHRRRTSLHTRLVLVSTLVLLVGGAVTFGIFEWEHTLAGMPIHERILNALFGSVTARTAGFNTVDYGAVSASTAFATILLMFVGGAPGSTAGGVKVTTVALLVVLALARIRGQRHVSAFHRTIPEETIGRAIGIVVIAGMLLTGMLFLLLVVDPRAAAHGSFLRYMFEATSAFATVGLSMNLTPELSPAGRLVIVVLMFVGRVGVMTLAAALTLERRALPFRYAKEDVAIG